VNNAVLALVFLIMETQFKTAIAFQLLSNSSKNGAGKLDVLNRLPESNSNS
jgi:hypothetical protein